MALRWRMLAVLVAARLALGLAFQSAGSAGPFLAPAFGADLSDVGTLVGAFMLPGLALAIPAGTLGARHGDKAMVMLGLVAMTAGQAVSGFAESWWALSAGRTLSGAGAVFLQVLMLKMAFDWFVGTKDLFVATSIYIAGWPVGHALGQALLTAAAEAGGWPWAFHAAGIACAAALLALALGYGPPESAAARVQAPLSALSRREFGLVTLAGVLWMAVNGAYVVVLGFGPEILIERGAAPVAASEAASLMPGAFLVGLPLGAWIATRTRAPDALMVASLGASAAAAAAIAAGAGGWLFLPLGLAMSLGVAPMAALPSETLREEVRSAGLGWYFVWYFLGSAAFPPLAGAVGDATGGAAGPMTAAAAGLALCIGLLAAFRLGQARGAVL